MSKCKPVTGKSNTSDPFDNMDQALELFKFYENKGFADKQQMISLVTWLTPFIFGLLAFCTKEILEKDPFPYVTVLLACIAALALAGYTIYLICEFLSHAEANYCKADKVIDEIRNIPTQLSNIMLVKSKTDDPPLFRFIRKRFKWFHVGKIFIVLFLCSLVVFVFSLLVLYLIISR